MTITLRRSLITVAAMLFAFLALASCSDKQTERFNDAPRGDNDDSAAETMSFPDGFSNVAHKCDGPNMVYVIFHNDSAYGSVAVAPNDPRCSSAPG
jgi:hypothetical protein